MVDIQATVENLGDEDKIVKSRTVYDVSYKELMWRNFLAGLSRSAGMIIVQFVFFAVVAGIAAQFILPQIMGLFGGYFQTLNKLQGGASQSQFSFDSIKQLLPKN